MRSTDNVLAEVADGTATLTLNRPARRNAGTVQMQSEWLPTMVPKPIVTAIGDPCVGVGLAQALICDLRIAAPGAHFSTAFPRRGLPAMHGAEWLLERTTGASVAHDLLLTGRAFSGAEASRLAVVTEVAVEASPLDRALEIAHDMAANCSPASMAQIKDRWWASRAHTLHEAVEL